MRIIIITGEMCVLKIFFGCGSEHNGLTMSEHGHTDSFGQTRKPSLFTHVFEEKLQS